MTDLGIVIAALLLSAGAVAAALALRGRGGAGSHAEAMSLLQGQVSDGLGQTCAQVEALRQALRESLQGISGQMLKSAGDTGRLVSERLDSTTQVIGDVRQQLGQLEASSRRMLELGAEMARLQDILRPPKLRGALGELFLADLLGQVLPVNHYRLQYPFRGGETVDAAILLSKGIVPVDAKFPLDNFRKLVEATVEEERVAARKAFVRDVKAHMDAIAAKYIRMDEGTFDFALMYIPAENVYYEVIIKDDPAGGGLSLFNHALKKRVIPVSPNSFYAYLQTIILGLRGMRVEEQSREIVESLSGVRREFELFADAFRLVGQHLDNAGKKFADAQKRFGKVEAKVEQIDGMAKGLESGVNDQAVVPGCVDVEARG